VLLITGDSAFGFHTMELETAVRHQLPIVTVINYDRGGGMELAVYKPYGGFDELTHAPVRFDEIARAMGAHGEYCEKSEEVAPAIARAFASGKPAVVQVVTDMKTNALEARTGRRSSPGMAKTGCTDCGLGNRRSAPRTARRRRTRGQGIHASSPGGASGSSRLPGKPWGHRTCPVARSRWVICRRVADEPRGFRLRSSSHVQ